MARYQIYHESDDGERAKKAVRIADTAEQAIEKYCGPYGWRYKLSMYDADTHGEEWAVCLADPQGGINYNYRLFAMKI